MPLNQFKTILKVNLQYQHLTFTYNSAEFRKNKNFWWKTLFRISWLLKHKLARHKAFLAMHDRKYEPLSSSCKVAWFSEHFNSHRRKCSAHHATFHDASRFLTISIFYCAMSREKVNWIALEWMLFMFKFQSYYYFELISNGSNSSKALNKTGYSGFSLSWFWK